MAPPHAPDTRGAVLIGTLNISNEDGTIHLGGSWSSAFGDPISESQATDRSTFCPMPGGRSQAASDAPH
jgi:hypothetical protein